MANIDSNNKSALDALTKYVNQLRQEEGITPELIDFVDLSVAFSPVLAIRGEGIGQEVKVIEAMGGKYIVLHPMIQGSVTAEELKLMRLRYLLAIKAEQRLQFQPWIDKWGRK